MNIFFIGEVKDRRKGTIELKRKLRAKWPRAVFRILRGSGTAHHWVDVYTDLPEDQYDAVEEVAAEYAGTYFPDSLPGQFRCEACVFVASLEGHPDALRKDLGELT